MRHGHRPKVIRLGSKPRLLSFPFATPETQAAVCRIAAGARLLPEAKTFHRATVALPGEARGDEAAAYAATARQREAETSPPEVPSFPVGTLRVDRGGGVDELREIFLDPDLVLYPEGSKANRTTEKYEAWIAEGHEPPPARAIEQENGRLKLQDGHHRATALRAAGRETMLAWVSMTYLHEIGPGLFSGRGVSAEVAQELAGSYCDRPRRAAASSAFGGLFGTGR